MERPVVSILHNIPGRIRVCISWPPKNIERFEKGILLHKGIESVKYNPITKSLLIYYNPTLVSQMELVIRVAISLSLDYNLIKVSICNNSSMKGLHTWDCYSGISLLAAWYAKIMGGSLQVQNGLNWNASVSTIAAILKHAYLEVKNNGMYDLEVLSIIYLINATLKGNLLVGATITWLATFTRHLLEYQDDGIVLTAFKVCEEESNFTYYDVAIRQENDSDALKKAIQIISNSLNKLVGTYSNSKEIALKNQIKMVSKDHGNILEGIRNINDRIYLRLEF